MLLVLGGLLLIFFTQEQNAPGNVNFEPRNHCVRVTSMGFVLGLVATCARIQCQFFRLCSSLRESTFFIANIFLSVIQKSYHRLILLLTIKSLGKLDKFVNISHKFYLYNYANSSAER